MKLPIIKENFRFVNLIGYDGFSFGIWIFFAEGANVTLRLIRHETIHYHQQKEMLFVFQWVWYGIEYIIKLAKYRNHDAAYRNLSFEREAYDNEENVYYLKTRKRWAWAMYL